MTAPGTHHELCFGCGQANLFGLHLELDSVDADALAGRFFLKQDHQGPDGSAHPGIIGAALEEAIAHLSDHGDAGAAPGAPARVEIDYRGRAPVGSYVRLRAWLERDPAGGVMGHAVALTGDRDDTVAEARAFRFSDGPRGE